MFQDSSELSEAKWVPGSGLESSKNSINLTNEMIWAFKNRKI